MIETVQPTGLLGFFRRLFRFRVQTSAQSMCETQLHQALDELGEKTQKAKDVAKSAKRVMERRTERRKNPFLATELLKRDHERRKQG